MPLKGTITLNESGAECNKNEGHLQIPRTQGTQFLM